MLKFRDGTGFKLVSASVGTAVVETSKNLEKEPELIVDLEFQMHKLFRTRALPFPVYNPASIRYRNGNYQYVVSW